ncbi:MAG TPA: FadR/GntR family transcriptional regulator [Acetobacteraceae bacterium]|jgi:GntR family transcriptional repressor for pyruvate dehydrogenase complex
MAATGHCAIGTDLVRTVTESGTPPEARSSGPRRLYQDIARRIEIMLRDGGYAPGDRLPPERELAQRLGVSRPSTREAVIALEVAGIVEVRTSSGIYVRIAGPTSDIRLRHLLSGDPGPGPYEALEMRRLLEGEAAYRAATRLTENDSAALREALAAMRDDGGPVADRGNPADQAFHEQIAAASGNSVLAMMVRELWNARALPLWRRWIERTRTADMHLERVREHKQILECLNAGDGDGAREAMHAHIDAVARRFAQG